MIRGLRLGRIGLWNRDVVRYKNKIVGLNIGWFSCNEHDYGAEKVLNYLNAINFDYLNLWHRNRAIKRAYKSFEKTFGKDEFALKLKDSLVLSNSCSMLERSVYIRNRELEEMGERCLLYDGRYRLIVLGSQDDIEMYKKHIKSGIAYSEDFFLRHLDYQLVSSREKTTDYIAGSWGGNSYILLLINIDKEPYIEIADMVCEAYEHGRLLVYGGKSSGLALVDAEELIKAERQI